NCWLRESRAGSCTDSISSEGGCTTTTRFDDVGGEVTCAAVEALMPFTETVKLNEPAAAPFSVYCQAMLAVAPGASEAMVGFDAVTAEPPASAGAAKGAMPFTAA